MNAIISRILSFTVAVQAVLAVGFSPIAAAQNEIAPEEVVVTGSRREARSVYDSAAPIDVIGGEEFRNQGSGDMTTLLRNSVPSYNVNTQPISDAATVVRPANLRGLASDHTLVLINSKRRHRAAVITWLGNGVNDGAQGPDISVIPAIAVKQVEVLRDGAAAQYGSDAIAGIINFILKDYDEGGTFETRYGQFSDGGSDEDRKLITGNIGRPLTDNGFINASFEYSESDPTSRSIQRDDAAALIAGGNTDVANPAQVWGSPDIDDDLKTFYNLGLELDSNREFYSFGNYASKTVTGGFYFRNPNTRGGVFSSGRDANGVPIPLIGDETGNFDPANPSASVCQGLTLAQVANSADCFAFNERFPGGFTPNFGADTEDYSFVAGLRGTTEGGLNWDVSGSTGYNEADFFIYDTVNASLGSDSPTSFDPGSYEQRETHFHVDVSYPVTLDMLASDLNVASGFEWRKEEFKTGIGDRASWEEGPLANQGFSVGSNGFPGFGPLAEGEWDRSNIALYLDLEADITDRWLLGAAVRWEDFNDFGTTTNGKVASHFEITDGLAIRSTYSTGFRAPTPGQSNAFNISTVFNPELNGGEGDLENSGTIPSNHPVAQERGGQPLKPEKSTNWTAGIIWDQGDFSITADYFNITIEDRLGVSREYELTLEERQSLERSGVVGATSLAKFRFFGNGIETNTQGLDVVGTYELNSSYGQTTFNLAYNHTTTSVEDFDPNFIDATRIRELEEALPETRWSLTANHRMQNWRFLARYSHYGEWYDSEDEDATSDFDGIYNDYGMLDVEVAYTFDAGLTVVMGADNITDETPDENPNAAANVGNQYSQFAPGGFNGRFWYARLVYDF